MNGTEKQISWAADIQAEIVAALDEEIARTEPADYAAAPTLGQTLRRLYRIRPNQIQGFRDWVASLDDASQIITWFAADRRQFSTVAVASAARKAGAL